MPTYRYVCSTCHKEIKEFFLHKRDAPEKIVLPCTGQNRGDDCAFELALSGGNFKLSGGGWYQDGYSAKSEKGSAHGKSSTDTTTQSE